MNRHLSLPTVANQLKCNKGTFYSLLHGLTEEAYHFRREPGTWCLQEVICHLYDEEREDFRSRLFFIAHQIAGPMPTIDPGGWVASRMYMEQNPSEMLDRFLCERDESVERLLAMQSELLDNTCQHPKIGAMSGWLMLYNWYAHDLLHIRQIIRIKYAFLKQTAGVSLDYAGEW